MAKPELIEKYKSKVVVDGQKDPVYAAMMESLDNAVGKLVSILKENKLLQNTIIIFMSDNGGLIGTTDNSPLRSGKGYPYEGGIRIPMFVYWNGTIQPGSMCDLPISTIDILPTVCAITNTPLPEKEIDGRNISPVFTNENVDQFPLFWHFPHYRGNDVVPYSIIRDGDWKLIKRYEGEEFELYNLKNDLSEAIGLTKDNPGKVTELNNKLNEWLKLSHSKLPIVK